MSTTIIADRKYLKNLVNKVVAERMDPLEDPELHVAEREELKKSITIDLEERLEKAKEKYFRLLESASREMDYDSSAVKIVLQSGWDLIDSEDGNIAARLPQKIRDADEELKTLKIEKRDNSENSIDRQSIKNIKKGLALFSKTTGIPSSELYRKMPTKGGTGAISAGESFSTAYAVWLYKNLLPEVYVSNMSNIVMKVLNLRQSTLNKYAMEDKSLLELYKDVWRGKEDDDSEWQNSFRGGINNAPGLIDTWVEIKTLEDSTFKNQVFWLALLVSMLLLWGPSLAVGFFTIQGLALAIVGYYIDVAIQTILGGESDFRFTLIEPAALLAELEDYVSSLEQKYPNPEIDKIKKEDLAKINTILQNINSVLLENIKNIPDLENFSVATYPTNIGLTEKDLVSDVKNVLSQKIEDYKTDYDKFLNIEAQLHTSLGRAVRMINIKDKYARKSGFEKVQQSKLWPNPRSRRFPIRRGHPGEGPYGPPMVGLEAATIKEDYKDQQIKGQIRTFRRSLKKVLGRDWYRKLKLIKSGYNEMGLNRRSTQYKEGKFPLVEDIVRAGIHKKRWLEAFKAALQRAKPTWYARVSAEFEEDEWNQEVENMIGEYGDRFFPFHDADWNSYVHFETPDSRIVVLGILSEGQRISYISTIRIGDQNTKLIEPSKKVIDAAFEEQDAWKLDKHNGANLRESWNIKVSERADLGGEYQGQIDTLKQLIGKYEASDIEDIKDKINTIKLYVATLSGMKEQLEHFFTADEQAAIKEVGKYAWLLNLLLDR